MATSLPLKTDVVQEGASAKPAGFVADRTFFRLTVILLALAAVRLAGLAYSSVDLFDDEAQYWSWSRDLSFGYYSKPPLLAWVIAATTHVCGDAEWCVRSPAPLFYFGTGLLTFVSGKAFYDDRVGFWAALLTSLGPGVIFSGRIMSTDVPLLFFWAMAMVAYARLLSLPDWKWCVCLGVSLGLGFLSKYAMVYFIPGMLLSALFYEPARRLLRTRSFWMAIVIAVVLAAPNIAWNLGNDFATFHHTGDLVLGEKFRVSGVRLLEFLGSQFAVFGPVIFAMMVILAVGYHRRDLVTADRIMIAFFITPILLVTMISIVAHAYANWASVALIPGTLAAVAVLLRTRFSVLLTASLAIGAVLQAVILTTDVFAVQIALPFGYGNPYRRTLGLKEFAERAGHLADEYKTAAIVSDDRGQFAVLRYYLRGGSLPILSWGTSDSPSFDRDHPLTAQTPQPALFVSICPGEDRVKPFFADVQFLGLFPMPAVDRYFFASILSKPRGPIGILRECGT